MSKPRTTSQEDPFLTTASNRKQAGYRNPPKATLQVLPVVFSRPLYTRFWPKVDHNMCPASAGLLVTRTTPRRALLASNNSSNGSSMVYFDDQSSPSLGGLFLTVSAHVHIDWLYPVWQENHRVYPFRAAAHLFTKGEVMRMHRGGR